MSDDTFVFTDHMVFVSNQLWAVTAMVGAGLCLAVLLVIGLVALHTASRPHLDRVSFRILVCALLANTVFGVANAIGGKFTGPTWACGFTMFLLQLTLELSSFLIFSIALNLQLVVVHQVNGQKMEKFYIIGSAIISLCLTVPPYAARQYGWDVLVQDCWYSNDNQKERLAWQIGTQLFWTILIVAGEIVAASAVIIYVFQHVIRQRKYTRGSIPSTSRLRSGSVTSFNSRVAHAHEYRGIMIRIGLYPLASAIINLTSVACVLHATKENGIHNWTGYYVLLLSDFVYGGRAVVYALLAATDPALLRAIAAFVGHIRNSRSGRSASDSKGTMSAVTFRGPTQSMHQSHSVRIELSTIQRDDGSTDASHGVSGKSSQPQDPGHSYTGMRSPTTKGGFSAQEVVHDDHLDGVESAWFESPQSMMGNNQRYLWLQENMERRRLEALARDEERDAFKRQI